MKQNADTQSSPEKEPIPELNYDSSYWKSPFQEACTEFAKSHDYPDQSSKIYNFNGELHVRIALLPAEKVRSQWKEERPKTATHFGVLLGPQGFAQTAWFFEEGFVQRNRDTLFLRHPAELEDIKMAHASEPFADVRATCFDPENQSIFDPIDDESLLRYLKGVPNFEAPLEPEYAKRRFRLADLLEGIFLLLEKDPFRGKLFPVNALPQVEGGKALLEKLEGEYSDENFSFTRSLPFWWAESCHDAYLGNFWDDDDFEEFQSEANAVGEMAPELLENASYFDLVVGHAAELTSVLLLGAMSSDSQVGPKLVLRPNRNRVALTRLFDLLTGEFEKVDLDRLFENLGGWAKFAKQSFFELEATLIDQVRASISYRLCMHRYGTLAAVSTYDPKTKLPLDEMERRYQSLEEAYESFVDNGYKKLIGGPEPQLPHFLEIAYQRFMGSRSGRARSAESRNLLNLLGRSILFFMLEDALASESGREVAVEIEQEVRGKKPASDGRLLDLQLKLIKGISLDEEEDFVTSSLMDVMPGIIREHLRPVVEKRNRANHPPYDEESFLLEAQQHLPAAISKLREAFRNLELIVPQHFTSEDGKLVVNARSLMGSHFEYPENLFATELGHEKTPTDQLLLCWIFPRQSNPFQAQQTEPRESKKAPDGEGSDPSSVIAEPQVEDGQESTKLSQETKDALESMGQALREADEGIQKAKQTRIHGAVPLRRFFEKKTGFKEMVMTGVFDRVSKGEPVFEYVEE